MISVGFYTLGCKVSQYETEAISEAFAAAGFKISDFSEKNDIYVINTCTVTAEADRKSRQFIRRAKKQNPNALVLVCGCYSQRSPSEIEKIDGVDAIIGSGGKMNLVAIAKRLLEKREKILSVSDICNEPFEDMKITRGPRTRVYVKIEDGCECKCTYCAIPSARGNVRSKEKDKVIEEVEALAKSGVAEIVLTGIETGSYGADFNEDYGLADLLVDLDKRGSAKRIRLGSLAPELVGEKFVEKVKNLKVIAPHFHLSIQSGSDNVLKGMKRRYSRKIALENIERIRKNIKGATFTTDIMVGFPGESEADFLDTVSFVKEAEFLDAHVFAYSKRKGTPAENYDNQIPEHIKRRRSEELMQVVKSTRKSVLTDILNSGDELSVIFEQSCGEVWYGHSSTFVEVKVKSEEDLHGIMKNVKPKSLDGDVLLCDLC